MWDVFLSYWIQQFKVGFAMSQNLDQKFSSASVEVANHFWKAFLIKC